MPNTYTCECNSRYRDMGSKSKPGRSCTYVDHCEDADACPVGCQCNSVVNSEVDGFFCEPMDGYSAYYPEDEYLWITKPTPNKFRLDKALHICASQSAPDLELLGAKTLVLTQGEKYVEEGVRITDVSTVRPPPPPPPPPTTHAHAHMRPCAQSQRRRSFLLLLGPLSSVYFSLAGRQRAHPP